MLHESQSEILRQLRDSAVALLDERAEPFADRVPCCAAVSEELAEIDRALSEGRILQPEQMELLCGMAAQVP